MGIAVSYSRTLLAGLILTLLCTGCGDSGDDNDFPPDYGGTWDVRYVFSVDDCQIALPGVPGILDQHTIEQAESSLTLSARSGFFDTVPSEIEADGSFEVENVSEGDIFGVGVFCQLTSRVSYQSPTEGQSESLFSQTIVCDDGYACETLARGTALKQPA